MSESYAQRHGLKPLGAGIGLRRELLRRSCPPPPARWTGWRSSPRTSSPSGGRPQRALDACAERWTVLPARRGAQHRRAGAAGRGLRHRGWRRWWSGWTRPSSRTTSATRGWAGRTCTTCCRCPSREEAVEHVVPRVREVMARVGRPFLLENPSYYATHAGRARWTRPPSCGTWSSRPDCGLLLDVNNVYVNARNHGYDPRAFVDALPLERVVQVHLARARRASRTSSSTRTGRPSATTCGRSTATCWSAPGRCPR